jgi:DNA-binding IclR family transcriptional regulator
VLEIIGRRPATRAADLAAELGRDLVTFKRDVRKLKELGLTESLEVGYRLAPRAAALARARQP